MNFSRILFVELILIGPLMVSCSTEQKDYRGNRFGAEERCYGPDCAWLAALALLSASSTTPETNHPSPTALVRQPRIALECHLVDRETRAISECPEIEIRTQAQSDGKVRVERLHGSRLFVTLDREKERYEIILRIKECQRWIPSAAAGDSYVVNFGGSCDQPRQ